jgi:hypothetical protein
MTGAQFEILVDGKPQSYSELKGCCDCFPRNSSLKVGGPPRSHM